ncbi:MAG TPA: BamA/TamA family outer membrane protein [Chitinophagaceae bacterium]
MQLKKTNIIIIISCLSFAACSTTRSVPADDKLYTGATVKMEVPSSVSVRQKKTLRSDLEGLTRPRANTRFLGMPLKLGFYNMFAKAKEGSFFGRLRDRWGEPPALLSQLDLENNIKVLESFLENKGFFHAGVTGDTVVKKKKAHAEYKAITGPQYTIASVTFPSDSLILERAITSTAAETLLKVDAPYDLDLIKGERTRIDAVLKEQGFYYFSPDFLLVKVDSTIGEHKVNLFITVKEDIPSIAREVYHINDVYIYSNYSLSTAEIDTSKTYAEFYDGYYIVDKDKTFKPRMFSRNMQFKTGEVYNRTDHNQTLNRLINLNLFKFVKNRFEPVTWIDSPRLNAYYYLTPLPKKSLQAEITGTTKSNDFTGSEITFRWRNRNAFRGGEQLGFNLYIGSEIQRSGTLKDFNTYRSGAEINLSLPKFLVPFVDIPNEGAFAPRTNMRLGYDILNKRKLYTLNSFRAMYGFQWKQNIRRNNELYPINVNYVVPFNETDLYQQQKQQFPGLERATERQFILGSSYQFTYNDLAVVNQPPKAFFVNGLVDLSGNIAGLITGANAKKGDTIKLFNAPFAQFIKLEADGRYFHKMGPNMTWANRIILGYGLPYGNSIQIPFIKQFFVGGNNSLRGFRSRSVGPGIYRDPSINADFLPDQTGDIKLEVNTELRPHISGPFYGAVFFDAGNVWLKNDDRYTNKPGGQFSGKFLNQLAMDAGLGLRLDIKLFVIRLDVAFPLRKPWEQNPWVMDQIDFRDRDWRQDNIVYNLAIGYPF